MAKYGSYNGNLTNNEKKDFLETDTASSSNAIKRTIVSNYGQTDMKTGPYYGLSLIHI